jgi:hypothetical protein
VIQKPGFLFCSQNRKRNSAMPMRRQNAGDTPLPGGRPWLWRPPGAGCRTG